MDDCLEDQKMFEPFSAIKVTQYAWPVHEMTDSDFRDAFVHLKLDNIA